MAADSVGQIGLDLVVNKNGFEQQMKGINSLAKKAGAALAAAFAVKKIVDFGAQCIELGSDLAEVQNVVDVTFPQMSKQVDAFAQKAAASFGLSETIAKKFTGTFGAMAKAFGFNEQAAYEMSTTLTGLSGDVASFYNISQDEAYTKLKSVFTGETETLKDLGIVMTQNALDAYAMANGYGKTTQAMSEAEKVALRYKFVQDQLSLASGDFIRTSDGWANQVRILKLQFDSLKATIGQGLINVLTPVIKVINLIIGKLMSLANAFRSFTEMITGKKGSGGGASVAAAGMEEVAGSADKAGAALGGAGGAAKKAAKDMKGASTGIDELNIISSPDSSGGGGGSGGAGGGGYTADEFDMGEADTSAMDEMDSKYQGLIDRAKELAGLFKDGFKIGLGDTKVFDSIKENISSIKTSLLDIFTDPQVLKAFNQYLDSLAVNAGKKIGAFVSVGTTIADNLTGGMALYLQQNSDRIKNFFVDWFNINTEMENIKGNFAVALADIFTVFRSDSAKQITADIIKIFLDGFMGVLLLARSFGCDLLDLVTAPIIENTEGFKTAFSGILGAVQTVTSSIAETFQLFIDGMLGLYNEHVSPLIQSIKDGLTQIVGAILEVFHTYILPVIQYAAERFQEFNTSTLQPLIEKFLEFAGKVTDAIKMVWEEVLQPFILWFIENVAPIIGNNLRLAVDAFFNFLANVGDILSHVIDALSGLLDFLIGVFTGDWELAWDGIKRFLSSCWEAMKALVRTIFDAIKQRIDNTLTAIKSWWELIWNNIKSFADTLWTSIKEKASEIFTAIKDKLAEIWDGIKSKIEEKWNAIKSWFSDVWTNIKDSGAEKFNALKDKLAEIWDNVKQTIEDKWNAIKEWFGEIWQKIKDVFSLEEMLKVGENIMSKLWEGMSNIWDNVKEWLGDIADFVGSVWDGIVDGAKNLFSSAKEEAEEEERERKSSKTSSGDDGKDYSQVGPGFATGGFPEDGWFRASHGEIMGKFDNGQSVVANNMQITRGIAQAVQSGMRGAIAPLVSNMGNLVNAATPRLTMVGSAGNTSGAARLMGMADEAMAMASHPTDMSNQHLTMMVELLKKIVALIEAMDLTVNIDIREMKKKLAELDKRSGYALRTT